MTICRSVAHANVALKLCNYSPARITECSGANLAKTNSPVVVAEVADLVVISELTVDAKASTKRRETALPFRLEEMHGVLKWLHHPVLKYVML